MGNKINQFFTDNCNDRMHEVIIIRTFHEGPNTVWKVVNEHSKVNPSLADPYDSNAQTRISNAQEILNVGLDRMASRTLEAGSVRAMLKLAENLGILTLERLRNAGFGTYSKDDITVDPAYCARAYTLIRGKDPRPKSQLIQSPQEAYTKEQ